MARLKRTVLTHGLSERTGETGSSTAAEQRKPHVVKILRDAFSL